jgi:hypothetical protein
LGSHYAIAALSLWNSFCWWDTKRLFPLEHVSISHILNKQKKTGCWPSGIDCKRVQTHTVRYRCPAIQSSRWRWHTLDTNYGNRLGISGPCGCQRIQPGIRDVCHNHWSPNSAPMQFRTQFSCRLHPGHLLQQHSLLNTFLCPAIPWAIYLLQILIVFLW